MDESPATKEDLKVLAKDFKALSEDFKVSSGVVEVLTEDVKVLKQDVKVLTGDVKVLTEDVKILTGDVKVLAEDVKVVSRDLKDFKEVIVERIYDSETRLLKEFRKWAIPIQARVTVFEHSNIALTERVALIEERLNDLEQR